MPEGMVELVADPPGSDTYRPKIEENYLRATKYVAQNLWVVYDRSGMRYEFGSDDYSRLKTSSSAPFMEAPGAGFCEFTTAWALTRMQDPNGNTIDIEYWDTDSQLLVPGWIEWGGNSETGLNHLYRVKFWPLERPDKHESHRRGVTEYLNLRIHTITVSKLEPTIEIFRSYNLFYDEEGENDGYQSRLSSIETTGYPTQFFVYEDSELQHGPVVDVPSPSTIQNLRDVDNDGDVQRTIMDMNGDGIADLVNGRPADNMVWWVYLGGEYGNGNEWGFEPNEANKVLWTFDEEIKYLLFGNQLPPVPCGPPFAQCLRALIRSVDGGCDGADSCVEHDTFDITGDSIPDFVLVVNSCSGGANDGAPCRENADCPQGMCTSGGNSLRVYPGIAPDDDGLGAGFGPGMWWATPERYLHKENEYSAPSQTRQIHTFQEIVDINGDGLPDLVVTAVDPNAPPYVPPPDPPAALPYQWQVYLNTGYSFDSDPSTSTTLEPLPYFPAPYRIFSSTRSCIPMQIRHRQLATCRVSSSTSTATGCWTTRSTQR
jgi:hypothetical protein